MRRSLTWTTAMLLLALVLPIGAITAQELPRGIPAGAQEAKVTGHPDGEKLEVTIEGDDKVVRLLGVDAPEPENEEGYPECYAAEATARLKKMLPVGRTIYLEKDVTDKDKKKRLMRYVWFEGKSDGKAHMANEIMAREGFVVVKEEEKDTKYADRLAEAQEEAQGEEAGLWGECGGGHVAIVPLGHGDNPAPIGTTLNVEGQDITVSNPIFTYEYNFSAPKGGYVFLIVDVAITNVDEADEDHAYGSDRFAAIDLDTGAEFDDTFVLLDQPLDTGELSPGEYVYGQVALEVQETAQRIRIKYTADRAGGDVVYWLVTR